MDSVALGMSARRRVGWLVSPGHDLGCTLGGVAASLALVALHVGAGVSSVLLWWLWVLALDGPHVFATLSRTYLDAREWRTRGRLLWSSLGWFLAGPLAFVLSGVVGNRGPFVVFLSLAALWAYWHVVRQHSGILALYQRKGGETDARERRLDSVTLYVGLLAPFVAFLLTHAGARRRLGLAGPPTWEVGVAWGCLGAVLAVVLAQGGWQVWRWRTGRGVHGPKVLMLAAALGLTAVVFWPSISARMDFVMFAVAVTAFHNVQYHGIVWFYHRNRYHAPGVEPATYGLAPRVSQRFVLYAACGVAFTLVYRGLGCGLGVHPGCGEFDAHLPLVAGLTLRDFMEGAIWGVALHHYYLDQHIWRVRRDEGLSRDLKLGTETA
ncbi:hypothetical protein DRW03_25600 [Corallococcus sp. H22C18031201]|nr:hypothetical protein DRW03_25600 [Corallococcus sp. H22C18031201]